MSDLKEMPVVTVEQVNRLRNASIAYAEGSSKEIERLNALVAMQAEALKDAADEYMKLPHSLGYDITHVQKWREALSASSSTVAKWEAEKVKPLQEQVAMLRAGLIEIAERNYVDTARTEPYQSLLHNTQATAEAFMREERAKVLEEFGEKYRCVFREEKGKLYYVGTSIKELIDLEVEKIRAANKE